MFERLSAQTALQQGLIRSSRTANSFQTARNIYSRIDLLSLKQSLVGRVEVFSFNVNAGEPETLACRLGSLFRGD